MSGPRTLVIVPTYNEIENLETVVEKALEALPEARVLVVDDNSPDGTGEKADRMASREPRVQVLHRSSKRGLGSAYLEGFRWGMDHGFDLLVEIDADLSHDPSDLPRLIAASAESDLVIGSRYVPGGRVLGWSSGRHLLSRAGNLFARVSLAIPIHDSTSGFRCFRFEVLKGIELESVTTDGYGFQIDMAYRAVVGGYEVVEIPITFVERGLGRSKMSGRIVVEALLKVAFWGVRDLFTLRRGRRRSRVGKN